MTLQATDEPLADVGVFGGSGFYSFLDEVKDVELAPSKWGAAASPLSIGTIGNVRVAFLARHGRHHELPAHAVNYRANIDAMRQAGVRKVIAPFACGSLQPDIHPGDFVVVDQLVDRTTGRCDTYFDTFSDGPQHVSLADPYDETLRELLIEEAGTQGITVHSTGTVVVINGPRFSTRAESRWYREMGWHVINMTQYPEAALAREAGIAYAGLGLVTDYDAGLEGSADIEPVSQEQVFAFFQNNISRVRDLLFGAITRLNTVD